jgi:hypothetical protein
MFSLYDVFIMTTTHDSLYQDTQEVIEEYEDKAFVELAMNEEIPCCAGVHPKETRYYKKVKMRAEKLYALDKSK